MTDLRNTENTVNAEKQTLKRPPVLNKRLRTACEMAGDLTTFADIGADHGHLSAALLTEGAHRRGIVSDISAKALEKAAVCMRQQQLEARAVLRVADGLKALQDAPFVPQTVFVLGMGGDTISTILQRDALLLQGAKLIVGAHTEIEMLRRALVAIGYGILDEQYVVDRKRGYVLIAAEKQTEAAVPYTDRELFLGPVLLKNGGEAWRSALRRRASILAKELAALESSGQAQQKAKEYHRKIQETTWINETLQAREQKG